MAALATFIGKAVTEQALQHAQANSLSDTLVQQLQQSGLLSALPGLLDAATAAIAALQQEPGLADVPQHQETLNTLAPAAAATAGRVLGVQDVSTSLLTLVQHKVLLWPQLLDRAAVATPALRLCAAVMQNCCCCADLLIPTR